MEFEHSNEPLINDLRQQIANGTAIAIVGAGVSIGATNNAPVASWVGLLEDGIERCKLAGHPRPQAGWDDEMRALLKLTDTASLLSVAAQVSGYLRAPDDGRYGKWLRDCFEQLKPSDRSVLEALRDLDILIVTTNYDGLMEDVTGRRPVTWREAPLVEQILRGKEDAILHLHGYWENPGSVVLGSYEDIIQAPYMQGALRALLMTRTCVFVGFGAGLGDPNFEALFDWMRSVFARSQFPHYRLVRSSDLGEVQAQHAAEEQVIALSYGEQHSDLAPFLRNFVPQRSGKTATVGEQAPTITVLLPPKPARCIGRDEQVEALVGALLVGQPTPVLGSPGIGKSTICLQALHDPRVAKQFGARRYFVRCDGAATSEDLAAAIGAVLGIEPGPGLMGNITRELAIAPSIIALDNLETPWEQDELTTEAVLAEVADVDGLSLAVTLRGGNRPGGVAWREGIVVQPLSGDDPKRLFLAIAGEKHASDPHLDTLLAALAGIPLAIQLMAHAAEAETNLQGVWQRWENERTRMLTRGTGDHPQLSLAVSIERSIDSRRMTDEARHLLSLMGLLPDGVANADLNVLLPGSGNAAAATLRRVALAFDEGNRLRTLQPIREHLAADHAPETQDLQRAIAHYARLALELAAKCGERGGREAAARLSAESANIESILIRGLQGDEPFLSIRAAAEFGVFQRFTGLGSKVLLETACQAAERSKDGLGEANCRLRLAEIAFRRSKNAENDEEARAHFRKARQLFQQVPNVFGEADCILGLASIALLRSYLDVAQGHYEEALPLVRGKSTIGEANCIKGFGHVARVRGDHDAAYRHYQKAWRLYQEAEDLLGQANCARCLGDIAVERGVYDAASDHFQAAVPIFQEVGDALGEANCIFGLGEVLLRLSDDETCAKKADQLRQAACERYQVARPIYQMVGDVLGEANCIRGFGCVALARSDLENARTFLQQARMLYSRIPELWSVGWTHVMLARAACDEVERAQHVHAAREAWLSIKRDDLVRELDEQFGQEP